jgi:hypothetical protein
MCGPRVAKRLFAIGAVGGLMDVDLTRVKKVVEVSNPDAVNAYIAKGWVLLESASGQWDDNSPHIKYSLAWMQDGEPVKPAMY